jgi:hypothetical protein
MLKRTNWRTLLHRDSKPEQLKFDFYFDFASKQTGPSVAL